MAQPDFPFNYRELKPNKKRTSIKEFIESECERFYRENNISFWIAYFTSLLSKQYWIDLFRYGDWFDLLFPVLLFIGQLALLAVAIWIGSFTLNNVSPWIVGNVSPLFEHPEKANQNWVFKVFICVAVGVIGSFFFWLRGHYPKVYGIGEIGFALATAYASLTKFGRDEATLVWFGLLGAAYLVVRGLDNCSKKPVQSK